MNIPRGAPANYWNPTEIVFNGNMIIKSGFSTGILIVRTKDEKKGEENRV